MELEEAIILALQGKLTESVTSNKGNKVESKELTEDETEKALTSQQLKNMKENGSEHDEYSYFGIPSEIINNLDSLVADDAEFKSEVENAVSILVNKDVKYVIGYAPTQSDEYNKIYELTDDGRLGKLLVSWYAN